MEQNESEELECLELQLMEIEGLESAYNLQMHPSERDNLSVAQGLLGKGPIVLHPPSSSPDVTEGGLTELSGTVEVPDLLVSGQPVHLCFQLPRLYPLHAPAKLGVESSAPRQAHNAMVQAVASCAEQEIGGCCLLVAVQELKDAAMRLLASGEASAIDEATHQQQQQQQEAASVSAAASSCRVRRVVCLWFHHIKSPYKRKVIVEWARELNLGGASKPGYPGVILIEGAADDVQEYVSRLRALQWKAMQVRAEEDDDAPSAQEEELPSSCDPSHHRSAVSESRNARGAKDGSSQNRSDSFKRRLPLPLTELAENALGELGAMCKESGLSHIFASALKLPCAS